MNKSRNKMSMAQFYQKFGTLLILVVIFVASALISPKFLTVSNLSNVLRQIVVITVLGCGTCFVLISGNINIAYNGLIALLGCTACIVMTYTQSLVLAVAVPVAMGAVIGYLYGVCVTTFKIPGFITGLAFDSMASGAILLVTGGVAVSYTGLGNFSVFGQGYIGPIPISVLIMLAVLLICHFILSKTCFGRKVNAVGGNRIAATTSGINTNQVIRRVYLLDGIVCAVGAVLYMSRLNSGQPTGGDGCAFDAITAACVGGVSISGGNGGVPGTLVGAAIVGILNNMLNLMNVNADWQSVVSGVVILLAVAVDITVKNSIAKNMKKA